MRTSIMFAISLVSLSLLPNLASADITRFEATVAQVRSSCSKTGGTFEVHRDGKGYGCTRKNCDGKGGNCIVACGNDNKCVGATPTPAKSASSTTSKAADAKSSSAKTGAGSAK